MALLVNKDVLKKGYFQLARNVSKHSTMNYKLGAVLVKKKPISIGFNSYRCVNRSRVLRRFNAWSAHAEIVAMYSAGASEDLKGCSMYVYREGAFGTPANARPCDMCMTVMKEFGIKKVYYTIDTYPFWKEEKL